VRIVVAEDDALSRRLTQRTLEHAGYEVVAVENGGLAVDCLSSAGGPRLALLDWEMPGLDGLGVCRAIRVLKNRPYTYIILLTAKESKDDLVAGLEAGADDYLTKPCHAEELKARLRTGQRILALQDRLFYDARHDSLTQLPNRAYFLDRLIQCFDHSREDAAYTFAILFVDLDGFKGVNDSLGHAAGDELLTQVAARLLRSIRRDGPVSQASDIKASVRTAREDILARLGGDEFTVLLDGIRNDADATGISERIQKELNFPFPIAGRSVQISASIGISISGAGYNDAENMLRGADAAMYRSKTLGRMVISEETVPSERRIAAGADSLDPAPDPISFEVDFSRLE
jgi:two-component system cell cycle response regulator